MRREWAAKREVGVWREGKQGASVERGGGGMKFGKRIRSEALESWANFYFDYKELKHLLKQLVTNGAQEADEREFKRAILAEIDKVDVLRP